MDASKKNLIIAVSLLGVVGVAGVHQHMEGERLKGELQQFRGGEWSESPEEGGPGGRRNLGREREKTVASLYQDIHGDLSARGLVRMISSEGDGFQQHLAFIAISRATREELAGLREELSELETFRDQRELLEDYISIAERKFVGEDPQGVFAHLIGGNVRVNPRTAFFFSEWASSDPEGALAWFTEVDQGAGFGGGSVYRQSNRRSMFAALIEGVASKDMDRAIALFLGEGDGWSPSKEAAASSVSSGILEGAIRSGDDSALIDLMESVTFVSSHSGHGGEVLLRGFMEKTHDLDRGVGILKSLQPSKLVAGIAVLAGAQDAFSFQEQMDWMRVQLPDQEQFDGGVWRLISEENHDPWSDPFSISPSKVDQIHKLRSSLDEVQEGERRDAGVEVLVRAYLSEGEFGAGFDLAQTTSDVGVRDEISRELAREWVAKDPGGAAAGLPPEYLKGGRE